MFKFNKTALLFAVIIIEGYIVLSTEMLAIRQTLPFVGSGTDTVSIIIAAVLMPLACGYYYGGRFKPSARFSVRKKLVFNILVSQTILMLGLSFYSLALFFHGLTNIGISNRLALVTLYCAIFIVVPVYLLGQTIPLISNYFPKEKLSAITGRMLFFSTLGSFLGAVFSTLFLMATVGVHYTVAILIGLLTVLAILLSRRRFSECVAYSLALTICGIGLNSTYIMQALHIVSDNKYNTVEVLIDPNGDRQMVQNLDSSSLYNPNGYKHPYVQFLEQETLDPIRDAATPKDILVIGAGAFTFGLEDHLNNYDYVDIDSSIKKIAEDQVLQQKLTPNKHFIPMEGRAYLAQAKKKYDLVLLDTYRGDLTMPEHLLTREFYQQVKDRLKDNGIVAANFIVSPDFESAFSRHLDNTFRSVFPYVSRYLMSDDYQLWNKNPNMIQNVLYFYRRHPDDDADREIYTDDLNRVFYDKPHGRAFPSK